MSNAQTEIKEIKNAYSYVRLSSKKQLGDDKSGEARQMAKPQSIADANGWTLSNQTFSDLGVSSFKGQNRLKGNLGLFISLAQKKALLPHPVLILEAFDRWSRQDIDESESALMDLLKMGVAVHVGFSNKTFTRASTTSLADRVEILVALKAAHDYSKNLSERVTAAKQRKLAKLAEGDLTTNLGDMCPSWVEFSKATRSFIPNDKAAAVSSIFRAYLKGESLAGIATRLNEVDKIPSMYGGKWFRSSIRLILASKTVTGEFKGQMVFPQIINPKDFQKVQGLLERNKGRKGKRAELVNIFAGIMRCDCCKGAVSMTKNKGRNYSYYRCQYEGDGQCNQSKLFSTDIIEESFFLMIQKNGPDELLGNVDPKQQENLSTLRTNREAIARKIKVLLALDSDDSAEEIKLQYNAFKTKLATLDKEIAEMSNQLSVATGAPEAMSQIEKTLAIKGMMNVTEIKAHLLERLKDLELRQRLQVYIPSVVKQIRIDFNARKFFVDFASGKTIGIQDHRDEGTRVAMSQETKDKIRAKRLAYWAKKQSKH